MSSLHGNTSGLKAGQIRRLENLYRRRIPPELVITPELARDLSLLSGEIHRQIGVLIDRRGKIQFVIVGDGHQIVIPDLREYRLAPGRLRGLRCVHTHLKAEPLSEDDLTDLALLRLDLMAAIAVGSDHRPRHLNLAHLLPPASGQAPYRVLDPLDYHHTGIHCRDLIRALETEMAQVVTRLDAGDARERVILTSVTTAPKTVALDSLAELRDLAESAGLQVVASELQQRRRLDPRLVMGRGKLTQLTISALQRGVGLLIFDQELNPTQIRSIGDTTDLKVIDRTQLILDIFAQRARTREGKLQVELAQLKYLLPRLVTKNTAMSRLTGGIGGRGPGETKLEINRRRARRRISHLEKSLKQVRQRRGRQRAKRDKHNLPVVSLVGYTNAGKSTLLNSLTRSRVLAEKRLFATLDPTSRRLRLPGGTRILVTDTVGFIRNLPEDLKVAFRATLEELASASLLLHVIDISNPRFREQMSAVEALLADLELTHIPCLPILNKQDRVAPERGAGLARRLGGIPVCARQRNSLTDLIDILEMRLSGHGGTQC